MDVSDCILSAGRAVLELVEREWQPLSAAELEHRLDQAVEDILEAELVSKVERQPPSTIYVQLVQSQADAGQQMVAAASGSPAEEEEEEEEESQNQPDPKDSEAVKYISDLLQSSKSRARVSGRARLALSHSVLLSLTLLSEPVSYRAVSRRFQLEKGNIHRIFSSFCECVGAMEETHIRWPIGREAEEALFPLRGGLEEGGGVPRVLGVLGLTRIPIRLPMGRRDLERNTPDAKRTKRDAHPDSWLNLELVCDRRGRLTHCGVSRGSEVDGGRGLSGRLGRSPALMPAGSCLVAAPGFPLTAQVLTPYRRGQGPKEELFNKTLQEHFQILNRTVGSLKARFQRLKYLDVGNYERARAVVLTACVLHNVFVDMGRAPQGEFEQEEAWTHEEDGEEDEEGLRRRDSIAELLLKNVSVGKIT
ncbi:unnamed protein product [Menidia menidia]|uniref:(Atlantic silverside) hypothetical protein n=1 Tax=Menidia menidia TaxID=238744 RepID=A0A8S4B437_9TELE|nr:unnamed protein product [Menidia menidia]